MNKYHPKIIMLFGNKEVGKSTSAHHLGFCLERRYGLPCRLIAFADPIKQIAVEAFGMPKSLVYGTADEKNAITNWKWSDIPNSPNPNGGHMSIRQFLQFIGTEVFRKHFHSETWDRIFWDKIREGQKEYPAPIFICHDGRHYSELHVPTDFLGKTVKILIKRNTGHTDSHSSEKQLHEMSEDNFQFIITNDGPLKDLYTKLEEVLVELY